MWDYRKVRVKGLHDPGVIPGSRPLQHLQGWETQAQCFAEGRAPCSLSLPIPTVGGLAAAGLHKGISPIRGGCKQLKKVLCLHRSCPNSCLGHREWRRPRSPPDVRNEDPWCERRNIHIRRQLILSPLEYQGGS